MSEDPKQIVAAGYDRCGEAYSAARAHDPTPELELLTSLLPASARVLDIGCGGGVPVAATLARFGSVLGIDISASQVERARRNVPSARFVHGDIMQQSLPAGGFDAVVAFYALFHLPRAEHAELLSRTATWLRPGGHLLATLAHSDHPGYTEPDFFGVRMYWSHYGPSWYQARLAELGFQVLHLGVVGHGYRQVPGLPPERHPVVLARLPSRGRPEE